MATLLAAGTQAPNFSLMDGAGRTVTLAEFSGRYVILYFYPKDLTPGCTLEARAFQKALPKFRALDAEVLGISKDSPARHEKFATVCGLEFPLLSDESGAMVEQYGVWIQKSMFGKKYMGVARVTYLVGPDGCIKKVYPKVAPTKHPEEILRDLRALAKS